MYLYLSLIKVHSNNINPISSYIKAKCLVQETVQFNGYYGCSCCEIEGEPIMKLKGTKYVKTSTIVFPMKTMELPSKRTKEKTIAQAMVSLENNLVVIMFIKT